VTKPKVAGNNSVTNSQAVTCHATISQGEHLLSQQLGLRGLSPGIRRCDDGWSQAAVLSQAAMVKWKAIPTALENARKAWNLDQPLDPVFRTARPSALPHLGLGAMFNFRVNACPWLREALTAGKCMLGKPSSHMFSH
jgi:hypothetical protein